MQITKKRLFEVIEEETLSYLKGINEARNPPPGLKHIRGQAQKILRNLWSLMTEPRIAEKNKKVEEFLRAIKKNILFADYPRIVINNIVEGIRIFAGNPQTGAFTRLLTFFVEDLERRGIAVQDSGATGRTRKGSDPVHDPSVRGREAKQDQVEPYTDETKTTKAGMKYSGFETDLKKVAMAIISTKPEQPDIAALDDKPLPEPFKRLESLEGFLTNIRNRFRSTGYALQKKLLPLIKPIISQYEKKAAPLSDAERNYVEIAVGHLKDLEKKLEDEHRFTRSKTISGTTLGIKRGKKISWTDSKSKTRKSGMLPSAKMFKESEK